MLRSNIFLPVNSSRDPIRSASYIHTLAYSRSTIFCRSKMILSGINMNNYCKNSNTKLAGKRREKSKKGDER